MGSSPAKRTNAEGRLAQLVRAPALHAGSRGFESLIAHHQFRYESPDFSRFSLEGHL